MVVGDGERNASIDNPYEYRRSCSARLSEFLAVVEGVARTGSTVRDHQSRPLLHSSPIPTSPPRLSARSPSPSLGATQTQHIFRRITTRTLRLRISNVHFRDGVRHSVTSDGDRQQHQGPEHCLHDTKGCIAHFPLRYTLPTRSLDPELLIHPHNKLAPSSTTR